MTTIMIVIIYHDDHDDDDDDDEDDDAAADDGDDDADDDGDDGGGDDDLNGTSLYQTLRPRRATAPHTAVPRAAAPPTSSYLSAAASSLLSSMASRAEEEDIVREGASRVEEDIAKEGGSGKWSTAASCSSSPCVRQCPSMDQTRSQSIRRWVNQEEGVRQLLSSQSTVFFTLTGVDVV